MSVVCNKALTFFSNYVAFLFYLWLCVVSHFQILREVEKLGIGKMDNVQKFTNEDSSSIMDDYQTNQNTSIYGMAVPYVPPDLEKEQEEIVEAAQDQTSDIEEEAEDKIEDMAEDWKGQQESDIKQEEAT